jgi:hypothetical protein
MEWVIKVRDICIPMPRAWFAENRVAIEAFAQATLEAKPLYSHPTALDLFDAMIETYQALANSCALKATLQVQCCKSHLVHCGVAMRQHALIAAMRHQAKKATARALFLEHVPVEMLREIARHLDLSLLRAWKRADPYVARLLVQPPPVINWKAVAQKYVNYSSRLSEKEADFFEHICPAAYANNVATFSEWWDKRYEYGTWDNIDPARLVLAAIARGNAVAVWNALPWDPDIRHYMLDEAVANGRFTFIYKTLGYDQKTLVKYLFNDSDSCQRGRFERKRRHPVVEMLQQQHFSHVTWFFNKVEAMSWNLTTPNMRLIYNACAAYGHVDILDRFPNVCDKETFIYAISNGKSAAGLRWIEKRFPRLLLSRKGRKKGISYGTLKFAMSRGSPAVLQWLLEHGLFHLEFNGPALIDMASERNHTRTLAWLDRCFKELGPVPAWYVKRVSQKNKIK